MKKLALLCLLCAFSALNAQEWPNGVPQIPNLKEVKKAKYSQSLFILNSSDALNFQPFTNSSLFTENPNIKFPWRKPGGFHYSPNGSNRVLYSIPKGKKIQVFQAKTYVPNAERQLPKWNWRFPDGTIFVDQLINADNQIFELRIREKVNGKWQGQLFTPELAVSEEKTASQDISGDSLLVQILKLNKINYRYRVGKAKFYSSPDQAPDPERSPERHMKFVTSTISNVVPGFTPNDFIGAGLKCNQCHTHSGSAVGYGVSLRGGGDGDFSFWPFNETEFTAGVRFVDRVTLNTALPLEFK